MRYFKTICILIPATLFIFSCSSSTKSYKRPPLKYHGLTLSKEIDKHSTIAIPRIPTTDFTSQDEEVIALLKFENFSGKNLFRWEWIDPNGDLYLASDDFTLETSKGKYMKEATVWHSLALKDDTENLISGEWNVNVYINDEKVETKAFTLSTVKTSTIALPAGEIPKPFPTDWGLIIGVEEYAHLPDVQYARKDALIMKEYFIRILGVPEENIVMMIDSDATKGRIQGYLEKYLPSNVTRETTLYVYFAGHGAPDMQDGDPYLVPFDGDTLFIEQTGYKLRKFYNDLDALNIRKSYVFLDSCFSGTASRAADMLTQGTRPTLMYVKDVTLTTESIVSLSASSKGQTSNAYQDEEHGLFTYYLLRALKGEADTNDDKWISIKEVYDYVSRHVHRVARRLGTEQDPCISPSVEILKDAAIGRVLQ